MKVLFDDQVFTSQMYGGVSRYFAQILKKFYRHNLLDFNLSLVYSDNNYLEDVEFSNHLNFLKNKEFKGKYRIVKFFKKLNRLKSKRDLKKQRFDVFHPTYYDSYFLEYLSKKPFVLTIHDMIHEIYTGKYFKKDDVAIKQKKELAKKATKIIAVSENTKKDIAKLYDIDPDKIDVVYHASSLNPKKIRKIKIPEKFLLFVGDRDRYKNFNFFVKSIIPLLKKDNDLKLICAGGGFFKEDELNFFKDNYLENQILYYFINSDEELAFLYKNALAFVFPSLYEGFGIPILEAFSLGCPVVLSNASSFKELAQEEGIFFDPKDNNSIRESVEKVICDKQLRKDLSQKGLIYSKNFSWKKAAQQTKKIYESIF